MTYQQYWNDTVLEQTKAFWIQDVNDPRLLNFLQKETNLEASFRDGLTFIEERLGGVKGITFDIAAGVCWTSAIMSRFPLVDKICALDVSQHRLFRLAPLVFGQYQALEEKIWRECADLTELDIPANSADLVVFCQALYMFHRPVEMLRNVYRMLKPDGVVMIACENIASPSPWHARAVAAARAWWRHACEGELPPPDSSGRHAYLDKHYRSFLSAAGFRLHVQQLNYPVLPGSRVLGRNYFGSKVPR